MCVHASRCHFGGKKNLVAVSLKTGGQSRTRTLIRMLTYQFSDWSTKLGNSSGTSSEFHEVTNLVIPTEILAFFLGEALLLVLAFLFFSGDFFSFFFSFSLCLGFSSASDPSSLSEEDGLLSNLARERRGRSKRVVSLHIR